ncbi:MAG: HAMP domain-containing protein [Chloroflexi bacterium]|nr:HAMP domain-containing protein [Chloroflexota bacterium]
MDILGRLRMQYRITISVALGLAVILGVFAYLAISAVDDSRDAAKKERLVWARAMAIHVDDVMQRTLARTKVVAEHVAGEWQEPGFDPGESISGFVGFLPASSLALFQTDGSLVWTDVLSAEGDMTVLFSEPVVSTALGQGAGAVGPCREQSAPTACIAAPVGGSGSEPYGVLVRRLDLGDPDLNLLPSPQLGQEAHAELLTREGLVLAADAPELTGTSTHASGLADFLAEGVAGVRVHKPSEDGESHIVAYAPLSTMPGWGIAVEQETDVALAVADDLQQRILLFGILALVLAAGLAWFDVRQVVKPLTVLTSRAEKMAGGDLDTPITSTRKDEVGTLANTFESMRVKLKGSLEEIERRDRELEQRVQERTREVQSLYEELQRKEEVRGRLLEKVISAQEEERQRIARELHDETGQALTGIVMGLEAAEDALSREPDAARQRLQRAQSLAAQSIEAIRHLVVDLRPAALDDLGLVPALRAFAEARLGEKGIRLELRASGLKDRLSPPVETCIFRVVQEAVTNIVRHSGAASARIQIQRENGSVSLVVEDDGQGFDIAAVMSSEDSARALGLAGMEERIALVGGELVVESAPGQGTRIKATIPLESEAQGP